MFGNTLMNTFKCEHVFMHRAQPRVTLLLQGRRIASVSSYYLRMRSRSSHAFGRPVLCSHKHHKLNSASFMPSLLQITNKQASLPPGGERPYGHQQTQSQTHAVKRQTERSLPAHIINSRPLRGYERSDVSVRV